MADSSGVTCSRGTRPVKGGQRGRHPLTGETARNGQPAADLVRAELSQLRQPITVANDQDVDVFPSDVDERSDKLPPVAVAPLVPVQRAGDSEHDRARGDS